MRFFADGEGNGLFDVGGGGGLVGAVLAAGGVDGVVGAAATVLKWLGDGEEVADLRGGVAGDDA